MSDLADAAELGDLDEVRALVEAGATVNPDNGIDDIPLRVAAQEGFYAVVGYLLDHGADPNWQTHAIESAIHYAAGNGRVRSLAMLLDHGGDADLPAPIWITTPLHWAARFGQLESAKLLVERGATINLQGNDGATPVDVAMHNGHEEVAAFLREHGGKTRSELEAPST